MGMEIRVDWIKLDLRSCMTGMGSGGVGWGFWAGWGGKEGIVWGLRMWGFGVWGSGVWGSVVWRGSSVSDGELGVQSLRGGGEVVVGGGGAWVRWYI